MNQLPYPTETDASTGAGPLDDTTVPAAFLQDLRTDANSWRFLFDHKGFLHLRHHQHEHAGDRDLMVNQTNLVSDGAVPAHTTDPNLINPWGVSFGPTGPFWISDNGTGVTTIYNGAGDPVPVAGNTAITIPAPPDQTGASAPTGQVFNTAGTGFAVSENGVSGPSVFLFATEDGTIAGWSPTVDKGSAVTAVDNSQGDGAAVYKGLAIGNDGNASYLYAADFKNGMVDVFDSSFHQVNSFTDPNLPAGFAPFGVQVLQGKLFVTFAQQNAAQRDDVAGPGNGFVDEFDLNGGLLARVASTGALNSPWGLDIAPPSFGKLAGDLLVGNFGDGTIHAYDLKTDMLAGTLLNSEGKPLVIDGLWALTNGNGGNGGDPNTVYFTAGPQQETHGLFGSLSPAQSGSANLTT